ncbi:MAG: hypothetical protein IPH20_06835 [Bacteroidales bacterium]|nr:hypothetical protein [Bacteroidales bacterium]
MKISDKENTFTFRTKEKPYEAGIDPYNYMVDRWETIERWIVEVGL